MTNAARAPSTLDRGSFETTIELLKAQPWLSTQAGALWDLINFCPSNDHSHMLLDLLGRTTHLTASQYFQEVDDLRSHVENIWKLVPAKTVFVSSNKDHTDSSQEVLNQLKSRKWDNSGWSKTQFHVKYRTALAACASGFTIVIVDDFVGSGGSMSKAIDWFTAEASKVPISVAIKVLTVCACADGVQAITAKGHDIHSEITLQKGLSGYLSGQALTDAVQRMNDLEDALASRSGDGFKRYRFGWAKQEAVYHREGGNTPNNVFPVFWWDKVKGIVRHTIMHRST